MKNLKLTLALLALLAFSPLTKGQHIEQNPTGVTNICPGSMVTFVVAASQNNGGDISFQWQYSLDGQTFFDLVNNDGYHHWSETGVYDDYSNAWYDTLIIENIPSTLNHRIYRCVVTEQYPDPSDPTNILISTANSDTCLLELDTIKPELQVQTATVYLDSTGNYIISASDLVTYVSDNCSPPDHIKIVIDPQAVSCSDIGDRLVDVNAIDSAGNISTRTTAVTVVDTIRPDFDHPYNSPQNPIIAYLDNNGYALLRSDTLPLQNVWDNCAIKDTILVSDDGEEFQQVECHCDMVNQTFQGWVKLVDSSENAKLKIAYLLVKDTIRPQLQTVGDETNRYLIALGADGTAKIPVANIIISATDNCSVVDTLINDQNIDTLLFNCQNVGDTNIVVRIRDFSGNVAEKRAYLKIIDTTLDLLTCNNYTRTANSSGQYIVQGSEFDPIVADSCGILSITNDYNNSATLAGETLSVGTHYITWTAIDVNNNARSCTSIIYINELTSLAEQKLLFKIFPNPAKNYITIQTNQSKTKLIISDITGKIIKQLYLTNSQSTINISDLKPGAYILNLSSENSKNQTILMKY